MRDTSTIASDGIMQAAESIQAAFNLIEQIDRLCEWRLRQSPRYRDLKDEQALHRIGHAVAEARSKIIARAERNVALLRECNELVKLAEARAEVGSSTWTD